MSDGQHMQGHTFESPIRPQPPRTIWPVVALFICVIALSVALAYKSWPKTSTRTTNADGTAQLVIDNAKLLIAIAFAQKPNGHVDPIKADANGYVLCAPAPPPEVKP